MAGGGGTAGAVFGDDQREPVLPVVLTVIDGQQLGDSETEGKKATMAAAVISERTETEPGRARTPLPVAEQQGRAPSPAADGCPERAAHAALLAQVPLFAALEERERSLLLEACRVRRFKAGVALFHEGDPGDRLYIVLSGHVKIVLVAPDAMATILHVYGPGECLGELSLLDGAPRSATAVARDAVVALTLDQAAFRALFEPCPELALRMACRLAEMVRRLNHELQDSLRLDVPARIAKKLLELACRHGERTPEGVRIGLHLSQQELAQMVGATRAHVNQCLSGWRKRGILTVERERITLHKPEELGKRVY